MPLIRPARVLALFVGGVAMGAPDHETTPGFDELTGKWYGISRAEVPNEEIGLAFSPDGARLVHELETPEGRTLVPVDTATGEAGEPITPDFAWEEIHLGGDGRLFLETGEDGWQTWRAGEWLKADDPRQDNGGRRERRRDRGNRGWESPDGEHRVVAEDGRLVLRSGDDEERVLIESEEGHVFRDPPRWTDDSSRFAIWRTRDVEERRVHLVETAPEDQLQPKHSTYEYPKPGDEIDTRAPWVCFTDGREPIEPDRSLIENPYSCRRLAWRGDGERLTYEYVERGYGKYRIIETDSEARWQRVLVNEESETFVFVSGGTFRHDLDDGREIIWMSERDGWKHLYLLDGGDGSVVRQLTSGEWVVRGVEDVDEEARELLIRVSGYHDGQDPYFIHYARVDLDGGGMTVLTESPGDHDRFERSPDGEYYTCRWSRVDHPPVTELRRWSDGSLVRTLAEADASALDEAGWPAPEPFVAKGRDGRFDIHGIVILPPEFDPARSYPVIENIYAGPHDAFVPKSWRPWMAPMHELAVHDFIVVKIDGRGTNHRGREFHHFAYKNLKDAGFPDRIAWMRAAAEKYPQMDLERVGIFGGSAGGQSALGALLFHGDFYRAAAADCGCHDNRMDKIWWNEQWMDWPVGPHYEENSNVTHIDRLEGALLLTVGELDRNVDPASTYQVVDALIEADKDFEFLPLPGNGHGAGESRYAQRRRMEFFREHLGGPAPRE